MNKLVLALAGATLAAGCAQTPESKSAAAPATTACKAAPRELEVRDLEPGKGEDRVRFRTAVLVSYTGWLYDGCKADLKGAQFDSNRGQPVPFSLLVGTGKVIKGWDEGLMGMKAGGKRLLVIPPDKGYGTREIPGKIPANSTLVFEVELVDIAYQPPENK